MAGLAYRNLIHEERVLAEFIELVQVDSGTLAERSMADALMPRLASLGARIREDDAGRSLGGNCGNVLAWLPRSEGGPTGPTVLLSAHMDRVPPGLGIRPALEVAEGCALAAGRIRSDGTTVLAADDVVGIVAILETIRVLQERALPHPPLVVTFTIAEEGSLQGAKALCAAELGADLGFVLDAAGPVGTVVLAAPRQVKVEVTVHGTAAHAGIEPEAGVNAIMVAADALAALKVGRIDPLTTSNIGMFSAGEATNVVPARAEIQGEVRSHDNSRLEEQVALMRGAFEVAAARGGALVDFRVEEGYPGFRIERDSLPAALVARAIGAAGLDPPAFVSTGGGSDANILNGMGLPCVALGVGFENVHSTRESILCEQLFRCCAVTLAIAHLAGMPQG